MKVVLAALLCFVGVWDGNALSLVAPKIPAPFVTSRATGVHGSKRSAFSGRPRPPASTLTHAASKEESLFSHTEGNQHVEEAEFAPTTLGLGGYPTLIAMSALLAGVVYFFRSALQTIKAKNGSEQEKQPLLVALSVQGEHDIELQITDAEINAAVNAYKERTLVEQSATAMAGKKTKCIHPGKTPKCKDCPARGARMELEQVEESEQAVLTPLAAGKPTKKECIHPTYDRKCGDCPDRMAASVAMESAIDVIAGAKKKCIHPGKDPKCGDCPDRMAKAVMAPGTPPVVAGTQKKKCIHPGKDPKCGDCPDR